MAIKRVMMFKPTNNQHRRPTALAMTALLVTAATAAHAAEPTTGPAAAGGTLTVRSRATVAGADVHLRDVCRWTDADAALFAPLADLTVERLADGGATADVPAERLRATLRDAGVNVAAVRLGGAATCVVTRDITIAPTTAPAVAEAVQPARTPSAAEAECTAFHTLRERLVADAAERLNVPPADLQLTFAAADANLLNLVEPAFHFAVDAKHVAALGRVSWDVTVMSGGATQRATVSADARAWQTQLVMAVPAAYHEVLRAADVTERRVLVDRLGDDPPLKAAQAVGQQASRELKPGTVLTARLIDPVPLARVGQYVTVTLQQGGVQVRTVAKALEGGSYGQTIKVKSEATRDEFQVTLTGPQMATLGAPAGDPANGTANLASVRD